MSATTLLTRSFLAEYRRRPINVALLLLVPLVFVTAAAGVVADFARIVGGVPDADRLAAPTAGWAAAFLSGVAGYFLVAGSRAADRRLALAGMGPNRVVAARLITGLTLAVLATSAAIAALALRTDIGDPTRVVLGTALFAVIYLGIGVAVGSVVESEINGSLLIIFIWMVDVFLGPAMAGGDAWITRVFPTHFPTLVTLDAASGHAGPLGDVGWSLLWAVGAVAMAAAVFRLGNAPISWSAMSSTDRARWWTALRYGLRDYRRIPVMWVLLVALPVFFITLSFWITPDQPAPVEVTEGGLTTTAIISMIDIHGAIMVPITVAFLAGLTGVFVVQGSREADARLALAGFSSREILAARLGIILLGSALTTIVSLAVTGMDFSPHSWLWFSTGNALVAATYGLIGVVVGALAGRLGGLYLMFLLPFIDVGVAQNVMFSAAPPSWGVALPGRGGVSVLVDAAFSPTFDRYDQLALAVSWVLILLIAAGAVVRHIARPVRV